MNELATREEPRQLAQLSDSDLIRVMTNSLYPGAKQESCALVLSYCRAAGLDPMQKPVHIVGMSVKVGKDKYEWRDVIMPGIDQYRIKASRSREYVGISKPVFGPLVTYKLSGVEIEVPEWCEITARRLVQGITAEFSAVEYWIENYATAGKDTTAPNSMWKKRSRGQLAKCAEAQALRKAFPEFSAGPTAEEMEGKIIDITGDQVDSEVTHAIEHKPTGPQPYPAESFAKNFLTWKELITSGAKTTEQIISMVSTKWTLSEAQKAEIIAIQQAPINEQN